MCRFYLNSHCSKGDRCIFMHGQFNLQFKGGFRSTQNCSTEELKIVGITRAWKRRLGLAVYSCTPYDDTFCCYRLE